MLTNKQTNKRRSSRFEVVFWFKDTPENQDLMKKADELRKRDNWSISELGRVAFAEYVSRHFPGNPTVPLTTFMPNGPGFSQAAQEKMDPDEGHHVEVDCSECSGSGENHWGGACRGCNGIGKIGVEK